MADLTQAISVVSNGALLVLVALIGGWFGKRVAELETRVDELEEEQQLHWKRERFLLDFIYRNGLTPPEFPEEIAK